MKKVICKSCGKVVDFKPIPYGDGYIATCPVCKGLAYNSDKKES